MFRHKSPSKMHILIKDHSSLSVEGPVASWYALYPISCNKTDRDANAMF